MSGMDHVLQLSPLMANTSTAECINGTVIGVPVSLKVVGGLTSVASMLGACLIVLSYILVPGIRTKAREILVNLSFMDFMAAAANFLGLVFQLDSQDSPAGLCIAQAAFAMYGTLSSVLWTICLAIYVYLRIMLENPRHSQRAMYGFYLSCYGIPLIMTLWFSLTDKLGTDHYGGSGWCSLKVYQHGKPLKFNAVIGNDIWMYLTMILVPIIFFSLHFHLRHQVQGAVLPSAVANVERKLMLIPVLFILLRVWSLLLVLLEVELGVVLSCPVVLMLLHLAGIGDSGQGLANAVLFVLFTPKVRRYFLSLCVCSAWVKKAKYEAIPVNESDDSETTQSEVSSNHDVDAQSLLVNAS